ncbi:nickel/cobalt transporter [Rhodoblastus sp.]|uniref:nickel/cobalt transporter n=1 Tax=Rhodoblastus sp. TaxID=1962975 RepID=UPI0035B1647F
MKRLGLALGALALSGAQASAQFAPKNPFSVGVNEGAVGEVGRVGLWLLQQQAHFYQALRVAVSAAEVNPWAALSLAAVAFAYGIFHAAGPGHGKAVIASYMLANEQALRRGMILSALAALLQALVAIAIVGIAALALGATAQKMTAATQAVEIASYFCITAFGLWLVWRKGAGLAAALRAPPLPVAARFRCDDGSQDGPHGPDCAHCIAPDPSRLGERFSWRESVATVVVAGSRPCSGALLVLVFAAAQRVFLIGVYAVFAMAAGTALTTAALAASAVLAKGAAAKMLGAGQRRAEIFGRVLEVAAACVVLGLGASLLAGLVAGGGV